MKNIKKIIAILLMCLAVLNLSACNSSTNSEVNDYDIPETEYKDLKFIINGNMIEIKNTEEELVGGINLEGLEYLFEEIHRENPELKGTSEPSEKLKELFSSSKEIVLEYVSQADIIRDEDKEDIRKAILNQKLIVAEFQEKYAGYGMITYEDTIYVEETIEEMFNDEYVFIHELIHVINSVTAKGSKYEYTYFNNGGVYEGITDVIAVNLAAEYGIYSDLIPITQYRKFDETVYTLSSKDEFDLFEAYYYPDNYDKLIEIAGENFCKTIFASVFTIENGYSWSNYLACNYYMQLE